MAVRRPNYTIPRPWRALHHVALEIRQDLSGFKFRRAQPPLIDLLVPTMRTKSADDWETGRAPSWLERARLMFTAKQSRLMFTAKQFRAKAAESTELLKAASLPAETREFRRLEQSYLTPAEEWMAENLEKIDSPGADDN
jgi:hypothetical protein